MPGARDLVAEQAHRFATIDPLLPASDSVPEGHTLVATVADGTRVTAVVRTETLSDAPTPESLWSADTTWHVTPLVGAHGWAGLDAVLRACRAWMDREPPGGDSACRIVWPSRDAECARSLLDHGFITVAALGVRMGGDPGPAGDVAVREAGPKDVDAVLALEADEIAYSAQFLRGTRVDGRAYRARREQLAARLTDHFTEHPGTVWLAEVGGEVAGMAEADWTDVTPATAHATPHGPGTARDATALLPEGRWGHLHSVVVRPDQRGRGAGHALARTAHAALAEAGVRGSFLFYSPLNPLSAVFWHRRGYRPLWTVWEVRPAGDLR